MNLRQLAERVKKLTKPCREVDLLVKAAVYGGEARVSPYNGQWCLYDGQDRSGREKLKERPYSVPHAVWSKDDYTASLDSAMSLAALVSSKWKRPHNLVIASAYGSAYIVPNDGASYGVNDPLKGEARALGDDETGRTARAITAACLRALSLTEEEGRDG